MFDIFSLNSERFTRVKIAHTIRNVDLTAIATVISGDLTPEAGDLVLARVDKIGQHPNIELVNGRKACLFVGDEILVSYGNRYAPDQFEAEIPQDLSPCELVAAGGLAAKVISKHMNIALATAITPIGLVGNSKGKRINLSDFALQPANYIGKRPFTLAVLGNSMNSGKTTTAANLIKGLAMDGMKVGAAKITGTGAGNDTWLMRDAGASYVLDFIDAGYPSTYLISPEAVETIFLTLTTHLAAKGVEAIVLEIADGLYQKETSQLVSSPTFHHAVDGIFYATTSSLGATAGVQLLQRYQLQVLGISGVVSSSPLASRETAQAIGLPVLNPEMLRAEAANLISRLSEFKIPLPVMS